MEMFLLDHGLELTDWLRNVLYVCYAISLCLLTITILLYVLNLKQLGLPHQKPRKKSGAILVIFYMFAVLFWQLFVVVYVSTGRNSKTLLGIVIYSALICYVFRVAFLLRMLVGTVYWQKTLGTEGLKKYLMVVVIPVLLVVAMIVDCRVNKASTYPDDLFSQTFVRWILIGIQLFTWCTNGIICIVVGIIMSSNKKKANKNTMQILKQLTHAFSLRNNVLMWVWFTLVASLNISSFTSEVSRLKVGVVIVIHALLGPLTFFGWFVFYEKEFRKPFRWQRQNDVTRHNKVAVPSEVSLTV